ncbi:hypothetical protein [Aporhodopirellula aestuarii]|uniref:Uncharacterized protein n=1 Tax=Aporhodopirellula aestuarii TaxID=2950107 RepID=A0ABT0U984_9BACT|nr:hypothetical protein [Aporhodopirellula aestuarii]MCM2373534.1 hypothetical protein [Aporhodopirellula aestuarii]
MTDNPYEAPSSFPSSPHSHLLEPQQPAERPVGVTLLAALNFIGGVLLFGVQFLLIANLGAMEESLRTVGIPPILMIVGVMFLALLAIASGVGMWLGTKWGWWLASFYYVYSVFRNGSALLTVISMADQLEDTARGPGYYIAKHSVRIVIHALLFLYFFKGNVLAFFGLANLNKGQAVGILIGACTAISVAMTAVGLALN